MMMPLTVMRDFFAFNQSHGIVRSLLDRWGYEAGSIQFIRASQNFVLRFRRDDTPYILRLSHADERSLEEIQSELEFLVYLAEHQVHVHVPIPSQNGLKIETIVTPMGILHGVVFTFLEGEHVETPDYVRWGSALGEVHRLSQNYNSEGKRSTCFQHLEGIREALPLHETEAQQELNVLENWVKGLPLGKEHFGLIHFDFELDNLFWKSDRVGIIDFDGCANYWFAADLAFALRDLFEDGVDVQNPHFQHFLEGYRQHKEFADFWVETLPMFLRLHRLLALTKLLHVVQTDDREDPEWVVNLRTRLQGKIEGYRNELLELHG